MTNLLYIIAVILIIGWLFGFFYIGASSLIHLILVIAVILILFQFLRDRR